MKHSLSQTLLSLVCCGLSAQIPNAGFESWQNVTGWFENPVGWWTNNNQLVTPVTKDTVRYQGSYSMRVTASGQASCALALPFPDPASLGFHFRSQTSSTDTFKIVVQMKNNGNYFTAGTWTTNVNSNPWLTGSISFSNVNLPQPSDSMRIHIFASAQQYAFINLDAFTLQAISTDLKKFSCTNPVVITENGFLTQACGSQRLQLSIYDLCGREIRRVSDSVPGDSFNFSDLSPGIYVVRVQSGSSASAMKFVVRQH